MTDYTKLTDFSAKDDLPTGDPEKTAFGADVDAELDALVVAIASKCDESREGAANGICPLDASGLVAESDLPKGIAWSTLTDAATVAVDASLSNNFKVTLGGNRTMGEPTNLRNGQVLVFRITQDGTGTRTLTWASIYKWPTNGTEPTLSAGAADVDMFVGIYDSATSAIYMSTSGLDFA